MKTYTVDVICAWCKKKYGEKSGFRSPEPTHGSCPECHEINMAEIEKTQQEKRHEPLF